MVRYIWKNLDTEEVIEVDRPLAESGRGPEPAEVPSGIHEGKWVKPLVMPGFTKASFLDGRREKTDQGFANLKRASELEIVAADTANLKDKAKVRAEIAKLTKL